MKKDEEDNIDQRFKEGLSKAEDNIAFRNDDWDAMEKMLDEEKRRKGVIFYLPRIITGIAALLLLTLGFFFLRPGSKSDADKNNVAKVKPSGSNNNSTNNTNGNPANNTVADSGTTTNPPNNTTSSNPANKNDTKLANNNKKPVNKKGTYTNPINGNTATTGLKPGLKDQQTVLLGSSGQLSASVYGTRAGKKSTEQPGNPASNRLATGNENNGDYTDLNPAGAPANRNQIGLSNNSAEVLAASGINTLNNNTALTTANLSTTDKQLDNNSKRYAAAVKQQQKKKSAVNALWPGNALVLSVLTAPDVNGVGSSFSRAQVGTTTGLMLSMGLGHRFTISTGAMYAKKPYAASFSQYNPTYQFKITPTDVYADCRVLDIPINIDYRLYSKGRNMLAVGTGISSYFMLRENYKFDYNTNGATGPATYSIANKNQHILGILNINATYQRRINEKFGLNVQPYMKLPLTNIGYGRVDLQSTGVAVGVSWYLSSNRPK